MCIAIEPMVALGQSPVWLWRKDGWTVEPGCKWAAHYEHTVAVRQRKADILSSFEYLKEVLGDKKI